MKYINSNRFRIFKIVGILPLLIPAANLTAARAYHKPIYGFREYLKRISSYGKLLCNVGSFHCFIHDVYAAL